ncbi:MAG: tetratricopeptide repeat protein [Candidatus Eisenbacteria bacterium]|nr:tetratricopeptide repeat protein [Candidatus Eisenbacteria bacterium]
MSRAAGETIAAGHPAGSLPARASGRGNARGMLALFAASLLLRILFLFQLRASPTLLHPTADPLRYHERALEILSGDLLGSGVSFHSSPLYPYVLAIFYALTGKNLFAAYCLQAAVDALGVVLLFLLARRLGGALVGWLAGVIALGYQAFLFFTGELIEITLVLAFLTGAMILLVDDADARSNRRAHGAQPPHARSSARIHPTGRWTAGSQLRLFAAGLLLGLAVLGKPNILAAIPFLLAGWNLRAGRSWRALGRPAAACALGVALAIAPFTLRNAIVGHDFVLTSSNGGINFYIGNNEHADGTFRVDANMQDDLGASSLAAAEEALGRPLKPSQASTYWFRRGLEFLHAHPGKALLLQGRKLLLFVNAYEIPNYFDLDFFKRYSWLLRATPFRFGTIFPFALAGLVFAWPRRRALAPAYLFLAGYAASLIPFFMTSRYRLPLVPVLIVFAAFGLAGMLRWVPALRGLLAAQGATLPGAPRWKPVAAFALGALLAHLPLCKAEGFRAHQYGMIASVLKSQGKFAEAAEQYRRAIELGSGGVLFHNSLAVCLFELGDMAAGERSLRTALAIDPTYAPAWRNLGRLAESRRDTLAAIENYRRASDADGHFTEASLDLARLLIAKGENPEAEAVLRRLLERVPKSESALWDLALLLGTRMNRADEALRLTDRLLALHPGHADALRLRAHLQPSQATRP